MKTILVPTDFSNTSRNAAIYAIQLAKQLGIHEIVLYNSYTSPVNISPDPMIPAVDTIDFKQLEINAKSNLNFLKNELLQLGNHFSIQAIANYGSLADDMNIIVKEANADLIVMGITGGGFIEEKLIGSNTTSVARISDVPVIIVPPTYTYSHISRVVVVSDFVDVEDTMPFLPIKNILDQTKAKLMVLNVAEDSHHLVNEEDYECQTFKSLFEEYNPEFHFEVSTHFAETINDFATKHTIGLIIVIPKKHSIIDSFFTGSHTKTLAFHSLIPLMAIHQED